VNTHRVPVSVLSDDAHVFEASPVRKSGHRESWATSITPSITPCPAKGQREKWVSGTAGTKSNVIAGNFIGTRPFPQLLQAKGGLPADHLNMAAMTYPGTHLRLVYSIAGDADTPALALCPRTPQIRGLRIKNFLISLDSCYALVRKLGVLPIFRN